jgi:FAD:protein FMN transferase
MSEDRPGSNRRAFLTGQALQQQIAAGGAAIADAVSEPPMPTRGPTLLLRTPAMATDFDILLNVDGPADQLRVASEVLDDVHRLEQLLTVYRDDGGVALLNRALQNDQVPQTAERSSAGVPVDPELFALLQHAAEISERVAGAFDPASQSLIDLWRRCRREERLPLPVERQQALAATGVRHMQFDASRQCLACSQPGVGWNLGAIGKGYAVDRLADHLVERGVTNTLVHGGRSSARAMGGHARHDGWPIGLRDPLRPDRPFVTILLKDQALSTSGTAVQWFRHEGKRYGHIIDPRSGWPVETMLSVSVLAPQAALADALSTAFFVLGVEKALAACDTFPLVGAILFPFPADGRTLQPVFHNVPAERVFWPGDTP